MGHKENGGIGITGLKMGLACCFLPYNFLIRHFFCKSFVPFPSFSSLCRICYNSLEKMPRLLLPRKRLPIFVKWFANILSKNMGGTFLFAFGLKTLESIEISYSHVRIFSQTDVDEN